MAYRIPGRPTAPAGGADAAHATPIGPLQVTAPTRLSAGESAWWAFTAPHEGRVAFDAMLTTPLFEFGGPVSVRFYDSSLTFLDATGFGALIRDVPAGLSYIELRADFGEAATTYLRVSDYAPATDWITEDPVPIVAGHTPGMNWDMLPDADGYPVDPIGGYQPEVLPDPVVFRGDLGNYTGYLDPWDTGIGYEGNGRIKHTPDPEEECPHPYEITAAWRIAWASALAGITVEAEDNCGAPGIPEQYLTDRDGAVGGGGAAPLYALWLSSRTYLDWPIGRETLSSDIDATPPDGHQTIEDIVREAYWHASLTKAIKDGGDQELDVTLTGELPADQPPGYEDADLQWEGGPFHTGAPPTLLAVETRNVGRSDGDLDGGLLDPYGKWSWHVAVNPLVWDGDGDHLDGYWLINANPGAPFPSVTEAGGAAYSQGDTYSGHVVDGALDDVMEGSETVLDYGEFHQVSGGDPMIPGTEVAVVDPGDTAWTPVLDAAGAAAALTYEEPLTENNLTGRGHGALWFGGLLDARGGDTSVFFPALGRGPIDEFGQSTLQFPGLRFTFQRDRHRWVGTPVIPDVTGMVPVRKTPRRDGDGYESANRHLSDIPAERHVGGIWD